MSSVYRELGTHADIWHLPLASRKVCEGSGLPTGSWAQRGHEPCWGTAGPGGCVKAQGTPKPSTPHLPDLSFEETPC